MATIITDETYYLDTDAIIIAKSVARGSYQHSLVDGRSRWSGADLQGKAAKYGARYASSRRHLLAAIRAAGLWMIWLDGGYGRRVLVISSEPCEVAADGPRNGVRELVVKLHPAMEFGSVAIY